MIGNPYQVIDEAMDIVCDKEPVTRWVVKPLNDAATRFAVDIHRQNLPSIYGYLEIRPDTGLPPPALLALNIFMLCRWSVAGAARRTR